ncbi:hypothetical protein Syun_007221 [Stephania yunnanensis]|uniref:Pentatricopeptide repeat-containing protein n=1 Tax=Stephania yunnanensis TaxID=152371 RepID=A0AAP0KZ52_9MAGN
MLNACKLYGDIELAEYAAIEIMKLNPSSLGAYVLLKKILTFDDMLNANVVSRMVYRLLNQSLGMSLTYTMIIFRSYEISMRIKETWKYVKARECETLKPTLS